MVVTLPLRTPATLEAGFERTIRRQGKRRGRSIVLRPAARVGFGEHVPIAGRLLTTDGRPIVGAPVQLLTTTGAEPEQLVETLTTAADGRFRTSTTGLNSRRLRLALCRLVSGAAEPAHARDARAGRDLGPGQPAPRAQRPGGRVQRPCARAAGTCLKASSSRSRCGSRIAGRPSGPRAAMRVGSGRAGIASNAHEACSAIASASGCPRRAAIRSRQAFPVDAGGRGEGQVRSRQRESLEQRPTRGDRVLARFRQRLTYANVMSTVAVFIALGGSSYAALQIDSADIANNSVRGVDVRNRSLERTGHQAQRARRQEHPRVATRSRAAGSGRRSPHRDERSGSPAQVPDRDVPDRRCLRRDNGTPAGFVRRRRHRMREHRRAGRTRTTAAHPRRAEVGAQRSSAGAWRGADVGGLPVERDAGQTRRLVRHRPGRQRGCHAEHRRRRQGLPLRRRPEQLRSDARPLQHGRKEMSSLSAHLRQTEDHSRLRVSPRLSGLPSRSARRITERRRARLAASPGGDRRRASRVLDQWRVGRGGVGAGRGERRDVRGRDARRSELERRLRAGWRDRSSCPTRHRRSRDSRRPGRRRTTSARVEQEPARDVVEPVVNEVASARRRRRRVRRSCRRAAGVRGAAGSRHADRLPTSEPGGSGPESERGERQRLRSTAMTRRRQSRRRRPAAEPAQPPPVSPPARRAGGHPCRRRHEHRPGRAPATACTSCSRGESLWSIASDLLGDGASVAGVAREVNRLWELNEDRIATGRPGPAVRRHSPQAAMTEGTRRRSSTDGRSGRARWRGFTAAASGCWSRGPSRTRPSSSSGCSRSRVCRARTRSR